MAPPHINKALQQYQQIDKQVPAEYATPYHQVQLFMGAIQDSLIKAKSHIERCEVGPKGEQIGKAIGCINALRDVLNVEAGGELAANLDQLYEYMERRLLEANLKSDPAIVEEVAELFRPIKEGWDEIDPQKTVATPNGAADEISSSA